MLLHGIVASLLAVPVIPADAAEMATLASVGDVVVIARATGAEWSSFCFLDGPLREYDAVAVNQPEGRPPGVPFSGRIWALIEPGVVVQPGSRFVVTFVRHCSPFIVYALEPMAVAEPWSGASTA